MVPWYSPPLNQAGVCWFALSTAVFQSGDHVLQVDQMGQRWLRLEFLHFVSTSDGIVRLTVYGHLKRDRMYYAQVQRGRGV